MYRLEISKTKCYKYSPKIDKFIYLLQKDEIDVSTFDPLKRASRLIELVQFRKKSEGRTRLLCTAFMMLLVKGFVTRRAGETHIRDKRISGNKEERDSATEVVLDVFERQMKVCSCSKLAVINV